MALQAGEQVHKIYAVKVNRWDLVGLRFALQLTSFSEVYPLGVLRQEQLASFTMDVLSVRIYSYRQQ